MSGTETVDPDELRALAKKVGSTLGPLFEKAQQQFESTELNGPSFSTFGLELQAVYPTVQQFAMRDLETKSQNVASIIKRLGSTASLYDSAETASTIKGG